MRKAHGPPSRKRPSGPPCTWASPCCWPRDPVAGAAPPVIAVLRGLRRGEGAVRGQPLRVPDHHGLVAQCPGGQQKVLLSASSSRSWPAPCSSSRARGHQRVLVGLRLRLHPGLHRGQPHQGGDVENASNEADDVVVRLAREAVPRRGLLRRRRASSPCTTASAP
ncbi:hypothetical protein QJS66_02705 [Kocuria rhizophila]|nr:hypothetical protein QJS66_02705 [Kocuria rhizophila]